VTYTRDKVQEETGRETTNLSSTLNYDLSATFLPYRPISLSIYSNKTDSVVQGTYIPQYSLSSSSHGADLRLSFKRFPLIRLSYNHWEFLSELEPNPSKIDSYEIGVWGNITSLKTRYIINADLTNYERPDKSIESREVRAFSHTIIKKGITLRTDSHYLTSDSSKDFGVSLDLEINPFSRFGHDYSLSYKHTETEPTFLTTYRATGSWSYRFNSDLSSRFFLSGAIIDTGGEGVDSEKSTPLSLGLGLNYQKHIAGFETRAFYSGTYSTRMINRENERFIERPVTHNLGISISKGITSFARLYGDYNLFYLKSEGFDSISHLANLGIRGQGPGKAYWSLSSAYRNSRGNEIVATSDYENNIYTEKHGITYSLRFELGYPLFYKGAITLNSGYEKNRQDGITWENFYYESRINYLFTKNLSVQGWWHETFSTDKFNNLKTKTRDIEFSGIYRFKRVFITVEYKLRSTEEDSSFNRGRTVLLKVTRVL
jgi:hypothetical protein